MYSCLNIGLSSHALDFDLTNAHVVMSIKRPEGEEEDDDEDDYEEEDGGGGGAEYFLSCSKIVESSSCP